MNKNQFFIFLLVCICIFLAPNTLFSSNGVNLKVNSLMQSGICEDPAALNFNSACINADINGDGIAEGCCVYAGCLDPNFLEYYTQGFEADVPCTVEDPNCANPCFIEMVPGCLDSNACNFNPDANWSFSETDCVFLDGICEICVNGEIIDNDADNDGVCGDVDNCTGIDTIDGNCVFYGDVNQDGLIDSVDINLILAFLMNSSVELLGMDYNQDENVDLLDFIHIVYDYFDDIDVSSAVYENTSDVSIVLNYNSVDLISDEYISAILLTITTCADCDLTFAYPDNMLISTATELNDTTMKVLIMDDPRENSNLSGSILNNISTQYNIDFSQVQIVDSTGYVDYTIAYQLGDVNTDIQINILDVVYLVDMILSIASENNPYADINHDGLVNVMDVVLLVYYIFDM